MELVDIGVNLTAKHFRDDREAVVDRAVAAGVTTLILTGTSEAGSARAVALARARPDVLWSTAGVHPHDAKSATADTPATLAALAADARVCAIGECGLDFDRDFSPRPVQEAVLVSQLELAARVGLPVFLHERAAHARLHAILREHRARLVGGVVHCFTGGPKEAAAWLDLDLHLGVTGWVCDERRGDHLRAAVQTIPPHRLLLETDAPWLLPRDMRPKPRGGRNEPAFLPHVCHAVSALRHERPEAVAAASTRAARQLFGLTPSGARGGVEEGRGFG